MSQSLARGLAAPAVLVALVALPAVRSGAVGAPQSTDALVADLEWRSIGPANMAGRIMDIDALESDFSTVLVAAASGGVFKSTSAGTTWEPIFEDYGTSAIGDVAFFQPNPGIIWVGTGEPCTRNSISWGDGVYKSTDGGATFTNMGLADSHHISEVITHPTDPDVVYVAAQGHLWAHEGQHGIFKTTDGGATWQHLTNGLPDDGRTGASELKMDPSNPDVLYAGFWERIRYPNKFLSGGPNGGIFKSTDAGRSWQKLTNGLPTGDTGKIGISIHRANPRILVAIVEHGFQPGRGDAAFADMTQLGTGIYRSEDGGASWTFVNRDNPRPFYYSHIYIHPTDPQTVYMFEVSANVSRDGGRTFTDELPNMGGDFHAMWIDPNVPDRLYLGNDKGAYVSFDGGEHVTMFDNMAIGQYYAITLDNRDPYWVYGGLQDSGNWGGPSNSRDTNGILNDHWFKFHSGDGFHATVDPVDWRTVYTETQGGSIRRLDAINRQQGGSVTPRPDTVVNYDEYAQQAEGGGGRGGRGLGPNFRFNWSAAFTISPHNSNTLLFAGNHVFRSLDRGDSWRIISPDLTTNNPELTDRESGGITRDVTGAELHATIISVMESPVMPGVLWVGTDDGNVQVTRDDGGTWTNVRANIQGVPAGMWVSRVEPSRFDVATAYVTFDGHRSNRFDAWVYKTTDFGQTWTSISSNLPRSPVYVIEEGQKNPNLLFIGNEIGVWVTVDGGGTWTELDNGLPTVPVHDLVIHPRDLDLVAGTHGRSVWILDDISALEQLTPEVRSSNAHLFNSRVATLWKGISRGATRGHFLFMGRNPLTMSQQEPGNSPPEIQNSAFIHYYMGAGQSGPAVLEVRNSGGEGVYRAEVPVTPGVHRHQWNLRFVDMVAAAQAAAEGGAPGGRGGRGGGRGGFGGGRGGFGGGATAAPGTYAVSLTVGGETHVSTVTVRDDPGPDVIR